MDINRGCNFCCKTDWSFCSKEAVRLKWRLSVYWSTLISLFCFEPLVPDCVSFFFKSFVRCRYLVSSVFLRVEKYLFKVSLWRLFLVDGVQKSDIWRKENSPREWIKLVKRFQFWTPVWSLFGKSILLKCHLDFNSLWHQLGYNCDTNC